MSKTIDDKIDGKMKNGHNYEFTPVAIGKVNILSQHE